ncbi:MAG: hypothetical protein RIT25_1366 [Planctomycetota bacterium]
MLIGHWQANLESLSPRADFHALPLPDRLIPAARDLVAAHGVHAVYAANALAEPDGDFLALMVGDLLQGLCWFGSRGNLVIVAGEDVPAAAAAAAIQAARIPWRIAMGPGPLVDALVPHLASRPLLHRDQAWYAVRPRDADPGAAGHEVRLAQRGDREALMSATLQLNESDLHIDPRRVDRRWLRDSVLARIAEGSTHVIGPVGGVQAKLDVGSRGPGGCVIEGVFTMPAWRGRGLAAGLVATVAAQREEPIVCLHVGVGNAPARAAYARAGMAERGRCRLLLLG